VGALRKTAFPSPSLGQRTLATSTEISIWLLSS
jgi:hypothetical protein